MAAIRTSQRRDVDMTQGGILRHIIAFSLPLLLGNLFQQLYNTVDTWVVGNFVSNEAFSAVGTLGPVMNMLIGFFMGLSSGAGVVISQNYGAGDYGQVRKAVHTAVAMTFVVGTVLSVVGIALIPTMMALLDMPAEVLPEATTYLTIIFSGLLGQMVYNMGAGILRAVGDSRRPFYYLVVCAVMNTVLDLVFVLGFGMGVEGVAFATILSQLVSALLVLRTLTVSQDCIQLHWKELRIHFDILKHIISVGLPAALQMCITSFANVFAQRYINYFGPDAMSGWTAYNKVDQLLFLPMQSIALASTTFVGQNLGKGQVRRAKQGVTGAIFLAIGTTLLLMIPVMAFTPAIVAFFNDKPQVIEYGTLLLRWISPFYVLCCFNQVYAGALRGAGNSRIPMMIMLGSFVVFRQAYLFVMSFLWHELIPMAMSYPAGWLMSSILSTLYFYHTDLTKTRLTTPKA